MLSIRTNLSSLITQKSFTNSSNALSQAIERMSTGFKLNHAKDNAANYSIATDLSTKIGAYQVAEENTAMALDMVTTAEDTLSIFSDKLARARSLCVQARNGTYGKDSMAAIKSELKAIVSSLCQTKANTEYNGIKLLEKENELIANPDTGFIADVVQQTPEIVVTDPTELADAITNNTVIGISNAETLAELATLVNSGTTCAGKTIVLTEDIDLSSIPNWTPIGYSYSFRGNFNGNGHIISNLTITSTPKEKVGLFGHGINSTISNLGLENVNIVSSESYTGGLVGYTGGGINIDNCFVTGSITSAKGNVGGIAGQVLVPTAGSAITNCYADVNVVGSGSSGGLVGSTGRGELSISNSYTNGTVVANSDGAAGFIGYISINGAVVIEDSYSTCDVTAKNRTAGGLLGAILSSNVDISNCYSTGLVNPIDGFGGGLVARTQGGSSVLTITDSYSTGNVISRNGYIAGILGNIFSGDSVTITNCYSTGDVEAPHYVGSFVGTIDSGAQLTVTNSYSTGTATGWGGDFIYSTNGTQTIDSLSGKISNEELEQKLKNGELMDFDKGKIVGLQVGTGGTENSMIEMELGISFANLEQVWVNPTSSQALEIIDNLIEQVGAKQVEYGAISNRLMSAMDEISIKYENLMSTRSTIRDADISEVSSQYIQQQILQQASATLLATANQTPDLALRLIVNSRI